MSYERAQMIAAALSPEGDPRILADWLEEHGDDPTGSRMIRKFCRDTPQDEWHDEYSYFYELLEKLFLPKVLQDTDLRHAFGYAGDSGPYIPGPADIRPALPNDDVSLAPFTRFDVERVVAYSEGCNDESNWLVAGKLWDGRWFCLSAGCDYTTGWG